MRDGRQARLSAPAAWAAAHPRTLHQLREEADGWARVGSLKLLLPGA